MQRPIFPNRNHSFLFRSFYVAHYFPSVFVFCFIAFWNTHASASYDFPDMQIEMTRFIVINLNIADDNVGWNGVTGTFYKFTQENIQVQLFP